jgi:hypothetical protein
MSEQLDCPTEETLDDLKSIDLVPDSIEFCLSDLA